MDSELPDRIKICGKFVRLLVQKVDNKWTAEYTYKKWPSKVCPHLYNTHCVVSRSAGTREKAEQALLKWHNEKQIR